MPFFQLLVFWVFGAFYAPVNGWYVNRPYITVVKMVVVFILPCEQALNEVADLVDVLTRDYLASVKKGAMTD